MKAIVRVLSVVLSGVLIVSCGAISQMTASDSNEAVQKEEPAMEATKSGVLIKVDEKSNGQKDLLDAVYLLERLHGKPVVVTNGGILQNGGAVVRYTLYFDVSESLYSTVVISGGRITSIDTMNKAGVALGPVKVSVENIIPGSNVHKVLEAGVSGSGTGG